MGVSLAFRPDGGVALDPDFDWLRGRTVVHKILIGLSEPHACMAVLMKELRRSGAEIRALALNPMGAGAFEVVLQVTGVGPEAARSMVERIAGYPAITSAAIEHVLIR